MLQQLNDTMAKVTAGVDGGEWAGAVNNISGLMPDPSKSNYVNNDPNQVKADIAGKITQLASDADVQQFQSDHHGVALQTIVNADPDLYAGIKKLYDGDLQSGKALTDSLNTKDGNGNKVSVEQGLQSFVQTAHVLTLALGSGGEPMGSDTAGKSGSNPGLDFQAIAQRSGQLDTLKQAYIDDIVSGKSLTDAINNGTDIGTATQQFTIDAADFGTVLPTDVVAQNAQKLQSNYSDAITNGLLDNATQDDVKSAFEDSNGNLDTAKLTDAIAQAEAKDPSIGKDSNGVQIKPDQMISAINTIIGDVRNKVKLQDSLNKFGKTLDGDNNPFKAPTGAYAEGYKRGALHFMGSILNAGVLAAKVGSNGGHASPTVTASQIGSGLQMTGGLLEAGSKYAKGTKITPLTETQLKGIESSGKALGGAGGIIGGALGIFSGIQSLASGDQAGAGVGLAQGITGTLSGISSTIEGGAGVAESLGAEVAPELLAGLGISSAVLGIVGGVTTLFSLVGLGIYGIVQGVQHVNDYTSQIEPELSQYGITGGTGVSTNPPVDPQPPVEP